MNDPHDPFNRAPLTIEQVLPRNDVREKIEEYKKHKQEQARKKALGQL